MDAKLYRQGEARALGLNDLEACRFYEIASYTPHSPEMVGKLVFSDGSCVWSLDGNDAWDVGDDYWDDKGLTFRPLGHGELIEIIE